MREIRFRAWHKEKKIMREVVSIGWTSCGMGNVLVVGELMENPSVYELMQFTGLYDKNGKEIWKGDIIDSSSSKEIVVYNEERARFEMQSINDVVPIKVFLKGQNEVDNIEVLGNIYENPELLENKHGK